MPAIRLMDVTKRYGRLEAIDDATFEVRDGEYLCVLGPTGSGKTTLLRLLAGIIQPNEGEIYMGDELVNGVSAEDRDAVYVPQTYALFTHLTVLGNVMFGPVARGSSASAAREKAMSVLKVVKLDQRAEAHPNELSGGMQQRVALARGLASGAKVLLLDEPLGALDARLRIDLRYYLRRLAKESGLTVVHVTHDQEEAMAIGDRILVLRKGRVQQHGTPFHIYNRPDSIFVSHFVGNSNFLEGVLAHRNRNGSVIRLRQGLQLKVSDISHEPEEAVIASFRESDARIQPASRRVNGSILDGTVAAVRFLGSSARCEVRLTNGDVLAVRIPLNGTRRPVRPGDSVNISIDPSEIAVYDYPTLGLQRELEAY